MKTVQVLMERRILPKINFFNNKNETKYLFFWVQKNTPVLHHSCPASLLSCITPFLHHSCPASLLSCITSELHHSCPAYTLHCNQQPSSSESFFLVFLPCPASIPPHISKFLRIKAECKRQKSCENLAKMFDNKYKNK